MTMTTYCGNCCETCTSREELKCPGCQAGPGRKFQPTCKLAKCCRDKGHETCASCIHRGNCGTYGNRAHMAQDRIRERERALLFQQEQAAKARQLKNWFWMLFWMFIPAAIASVMNTDLIVEKWPGLEKPGLILSLVCELVYIFGLFQMRNADGRYLKAAGLKLVSAVLSGLTLVTPVGSQIAKLSSLVYILATIASLVAMYQEYMAHADALSGIDPMMTDKWQNLWKLQIGLVIATFGSILLAFISKLLVALVLLGVLVGSLVASILKIAYLYQSAAACRDLAYYDDKVKKG